MSMNARRVRGGHRRLAAISGVLGLFLFSTGVSLAVQGSASGAKSGHIPVPICHATSSDTGPYVFETPDADSAQLAAHMAHRNTPNKTWKGAGWWNGVFHTAGSAKRDFIGNYTDHAGNLHVIDGTITAAFCNAEVVTRTAANPAVSFTDPACVDGVITDATFSVTSVPHVTYTQSGTAAAGQTVTFTATTAPGYVFSDGTTSKTISHTYAADPAECGGPPPIVHRTLGVITFSDPSCANPDGAHVLIGGVARTATVDLAGITYTLSGAIGSGTTVTVTPAADQGNVIDGTANPVSHTFTTVPDNCVKKPRKPIVFPAKPPVSHPSVPVKAPTHAPVVIPKVVHSGLESLPAGPNQALRSYGLGLTGAGAVFVALAFGLGRRDIGSKSGS